MEIFKNLTFSKKYKRSALAIGNFDGVHKGHQKVFIQAKKFSKKNNTKLPNEAIYLIRYHSFYAWHNPKNSSIRGYTNLASMYDWKMLPLLKAFQKADLYSKIEKNTIRIAFRLY